MPGFRQSLLIWLCALVIAEGGATAATLADPVVDTGLTVSTPRPDPDLVIVRERTYGAAGVDLTPFGIGTGSDDFVQSIYFRLYVGGTGTTEDAVLGTVTFPAGTTILGFITDPDDLGSSSPSGVYTGSDAYFAVSSNPSDYSTALRGFEPPGTGAGSAEFICQTDERSFVFGLDVKGGMDDFRVIVDYGTSFAPGNSLQVNLFEERLGNVTASTGIRIGDATGGAEPGNGDFGEVTHLVGIPLTTSDPPVAGVAPPASGRDMIYLSRETSSGPRIDGMEVGLDASVPSMIQASSSQIAHPRAVVFGLDGMLYMVDDPTGLAMADPNTGVVTPISYPAQPGVNVRMAALRGDSRLFILRQTSYPAAEDAFVDTYDTVTGVFTPNFAVFPTDLLPHPVDIIAGTDGILYGLGIGDAFHSVDPVTGAIHAFAQQIPNLPGDNVKGTADPYSGLIYLIRLSSGTAFIDSIDTVRGIFHAAVATLPPSVIPDPAAVVVDNDGMIWAFGKNGGVVAWDPAQPSLPPFYQTRCLDFLGFTTHAAIPRLPAEVSPPRAARQLDLTFSPTAGMLRISWEDGGPGASYNVYAGAIGDYYSHVPSLCHVAGSPDGLGSLFTDLPEPSTSTYYLVTASRMEGEGSAGARPISAFPPACGPFP
ncbi:MAG TPA: hypothetical protein VGK94_05500 [Candidatus Polarisedimenticolia bacterium]|jgi:hypothetical protein